MHDATFPTQVGAGRRLTLRSLAKSAGVSAMAFSLALRNLPGVAPATRQRLKKIAKEAGYRPDPTISKLMIHLRRQRSTRLKAMICALTVEPVSPSNPHTKAVFESARQHAQDLGYGFDLLCLRDLRHLSPHSLQRILSSRGVEGVLLLPMTSNDRIRGSIDWSRFSIVATSYSAAGPEFHKVVPDHFHNTLLIYRSLSELGFRRIGLVMTREMDARSNHRFSAAAAWHGMFCSGTPIAPLLTDGAMEDGLQVWFERNQLDAIISDSDHALKTVASTLKLGSTPSLGLASMSAKAGASGAHFAGIDECPDEIGREAVDVLARLIRHGEKGAPARPRVTMINGVWVRGAFVNRNPV